MNLVLGILFSQAHGKTSVNSRAKHCFWKSSRWKCQRRTNQTQRPKHFDLFRSGPGEFGNTAGWPACEPSRTNQMTPGEQEHNDARRRRRAARVAEDTKRAVRLPSCHLPELDLAGKRVSERTNHTFRLTGSWNRRMKIRSRTLIAELVKEAIIKICKCASIWQTSQT